MKTYLIAALLAVSNAWSTNISTDVKWGEDSASAFSLTIQGTGLDYVQTITSPNNLWELDIRAYGEYLPDQNVISFDDVVPSATFLGSPDLPRFNTRGYSYWLPVGSPLFVTAPFDESHGSVPGWTGNIPFVITSTPDLADNSTWTWVLNISADGPSLISADGPSLISAGGPSLLTKSVPESGGLVCLAFAAGLLLFFRPRKEKAWTS